MHVAVTREASHRYFLTLTPPAPLLDLLAQHGLTMECHLDPSGALSSDAKFAADRASLTHAPSKKRTYDMHSSGSSPSPPPSPAPFPLPADRVIHAYLSSLLLHPTTLEHTACTSAFFDLTPHANASVVGGATLPLRDKRLSLYLRTFIPHFALQFRLYVPHMNYFQQKSNLLGVTAPALVTSPFTFFSAGERGEEWTPAPLIMTDSRPFNVDISGWISQKKIIREKVQMIRIRVSIPPGMYMNVTRQTRVEVMETVGRPSRGVELADRVVGEDPAIVIEPLLASKKLGAFVNLPSGLMLSVGKRELVLRGDTESYIDLCARFEHRPSELAIPQDGLDRPKKLKGDVWTLHLALYLVHAPRRGDVVAYDGCRPQEVIFRKSTNDPERKKDVSDDAEDSNDAETILAPSDNEEMEEVAEEMEESESRGHDDRRATQWHPVVGGALQQARSAPVLPTAEPWRGAFFHEPARATTAQKKEKKGLVHSVTPSVALAAPVPGGAFVTTLLVSGVPKTARVVLNGTVALRPHPSEVATMHVMLVEIPCLFDLVVEECKTKGAAQLEQALRPRRSYVCRLSVHGKKMCTEYGGADITYQYDADVWGQCLAYVGSKMPTAGNATGSETGTETATVAELPGRASGEFTLDDDSDAELCLPRNCFFDEDYMKLLNHGY